MLVVALTGLSSAARYRLHQRHLRAYRKRVLGRGSEPRVRRRPDADPKSARCGRRVPARLSAMPRTAGTWLDRRCFFLDDFRNETGKTGRQVMCGIAGVWRKRNPIRRRDLSDVARMMLVLEHRGPDDHDSWSTAGLPLGSRRLAIIDPSPAAREPMRTACGQGILTYNGEVYNYRSLRGRLQPKDGLSDRLPTRSGSPACITGVPTSRTAVDACFRCLFRCADHIVACPDRLGINRCRWPRRPNGLCSPPRARLTSLRWFQRHRRARKSPCAWPAEPRFQLPAPGTNRLSMAARWNQGSLP